MAPPLPLVFLLMVVGASGAEWSVKYNQQEICALKGSTVFMNGTFTLPEGLTVTETFWILDPEKNLNWPDLRENSNYSGRVEYFTGKQKRFFLKLSNVTKKDEHEFCFRIKTDVEKQKYLGRPCIKLSVTELHVESPEEVTEGETADLTCKISCNLTDPTFIWYKNGRPLTIKTIRNNQLHLQTVSSEDAGSYNCAVRGSEHLPSTAQTLRVRYPPKNVSVSISPSGGIVEDSSVNLTCSSDANPPVQNYTWFKEGGSSPVGSGHTFSPLQSGSYYCQAQNQHGAQKSAAVPVILNTEPHHYHPVILYVAVGVIGVCGIAAFLTVVFWIRRKRSQDGNADEQVYENVRHKTHPPDDEKYSIPDYENVPDLRKHH
ncbi:Fc receptor-like protein 2 isoform X2 [Salminus brasiliensis]|uniref:Fc receptor-like protein 2 isoform X2 n=1 Tax=Salminus brasiliensis TaxID=930266 RepID=UPI003B82F691